MIVYLFFASSFRCSSACLAFIRFSSWAGEKGYAHQPAPFTGHVAKTAAELLRAGRLRLDAGAVDVLDGLIVPPFPIFVLPPNAKIAEGG